MMMISPNPNSNPNLNPLLSSSSSPIQVSDNDSYLTHSHIGGGGTSSASGSFQNNDGFLLGNDGGGSGSGNNSDVEFGFRRPELLGQTTPLVGTVQIYHRHVFLCYKNPKVWPPHIEAAEFDRLPRLLSAALLARKADITKQTRLTICEGHDGTETSNGDVLIFPDMIRYRRLTHFDIDTFVEEVLVKDSEWHPGTPETLTGSYVFVCSHGSRDRRCGVCGPALVTRFKEEIDARCLQGQVSVSPCSHIGGHKYAGNVIIFSRNVSGEVTGHWYGYVTPLMFLFCLNSILEKETLSIICGGVRWLSEEEQKKKQELRLQLNTTTNMEEHTNQTTFDGGVNQVTGCCQDVNGNSSSSSSSLCCQNQLKEEPKREVEKKKKKKTGGGGSRKVCRMPTWIESWKEKIRTPPLL